MKKFMNSKKGLSLGVLALTASLAVGSAMAYFTDTDHAENQITIGKVDIDLEEKEWDKLTPEEKTDITPNKEITKDPQVTNIGINDAFVFVTVEVPVADVITANDDGTKNPKAVTELFSWKTNEGWTRFGEVKDVTNEVGVVLAHEYSYVYGTDSTCTALKKGVATPKLFNSVKFANVIEGQTMADGTLLEEKTLNINLKAYGIQTTDLTEKDVTDPASVWQVLSNQTK